MERAAFAIFRSRRAAQEAMDALVSQGVSRDLVEVQLHEDERPRPAPVSHFYVRYGVPIVVLLGATAGALIAGWWGVLMGMLFAAVYGTSSRCSASSPRGSGTDRPCWSSTKTKEV